MINHHKQVGPKPRISKNDGTVSGSFCFDDAFTFQWCPSLAHVLSVTPALFISLRGVTHSIQHHFNYKVSMVVAPETQTSKSSKGTTLKCPIDAWSLTLAPHSKSWSIWKQAEHCRFVTRKAHTEDGMRREQTCPKGKPWSIFMTPPPPDQVAKEDLWFWGILPLAGYENSWPYWPPRFWMVWYRTLPNIKDDQFGLLLVVLNPSLCSASGSFFTSSRSMPRTSAGSDRAPRTQAVMPMPEPPRVMGLEDPREEDLNNRKMG